MIASGPVKWTWRVLLNSVTTKPQQTTTVLTLQNGNILRVTGALWGEPPTTVGFPSQRPVMRRFDIFYDARLNKRLSKQSICRWFETPWHSYCVMQSVNHEYSSWNILYRRIFYTDVLSIDQGCPRLYKHNRSNFMACSNISIITHRRHDTVKLAPLHM